MKVLATALSVCAVCAAAIPFAAGAQAQGASPHVLVATTGNDSEVRKTIPITRKSGKRPRVALSMGPDKLPSLSSGDQLKATSELEVTTDCYEKSQRCVGKPYTYNPIVEARVVLANGPFVTGGEGSVELASQKLKCRQKTPDRGHHCVIVFDDALLDVADPSQLPCTPGGNCYLNVSIQAHNKRKRSGKRNRLLVGEDEPDGSIVQDKGRLNAIRYSPADQPPVKPLISNELLTTSVPIRKGEDVVVYSQRIDGLEKNDQIVANAGMTTDVSGLSYATLIRTRLVLTPDPLAPRPNKEIKRITDPPAELAEANGFNCTQRQKICNTSKVGVITMIRNSKDDDGNPIPLYANLVLNTAKPGSAAPKSDAVELLPMGGVQVNVYPAALRG